MHTKHKKRKKYVKRKKRKRKKITFDTLTMSHYRNIFSWVLNSKVSLLFARNKIKFFSKLCLFKFNLFFPIKFLPLCHPTKRRQRDSPHSLSSCSIIFSFSFRVLQLLSLIYFETLSFIIKRWCLTLLSLSHTHALFGLSKLKFCVRVYVCERENMCRSLEFKLNAALCLWYIKVNAHKSYRMRERERSGGGCIDRSVER
jgi:hypothetical protein